MKKVITILVALGLVLSLTVMASPVSANCHLPLSACSVKVTPDVECETACYAVNFTTSAMGGLAAGVDDIVITFPATAVITGANATVKTIPATNITVAGMELHIVTPVSINFSESVIVNVCNVSNPVAGAYKLKARTTWDCECEMDFTIKEGGSISPTSAIWCMNSCKNVTTGITWGASTSVKNVTFCSNGTMVSWSTGADNATLNIACASLAVHNLSVCSTYEFCIDFDPGCNATLNVTVADVYNATLLKGWNLVSFPLIPINKAIEEVLKDIDANVCSVWYWDGCAEKWLVYKNGTSFDTLTTIEECNAYWIEMAAAANLSVCGYKYPCPPGAPPCCCYCHCWNMVSFHSTNTTMQLHQYLANLSPAGTFFGALTWTQAAGWQTVTNNTTMVPGQGYFMAFTTEPACFAPPV